MTTDGQVHERIEALVAEEHRLLEAHGNDALTEAEHARLEEVKVMLDQAWDLLRQRRARREAGLDPDGASERGPSTVENYLG